MSLALTRFHKAHAMSAVERMCGSSLISALRPQIRCALYAALITFMSVTIPLSALRPNWKVAPKELIRQKAAGN
jgi:hypothetical protein